MCGNFHQEEATKLLPGNDISAKEKTSADSMLSWISCVTGLFLVL